MATATKREGMGRKPLPPDQRRIRRVVFLKPETVRRLEIAAQTGETLSQTIDRVVATD